MTAGKRDHDLGYRRVAAALKGNEDIYALLRELSKARGGEAGLAMYGGAVCCVVSAFLTLRRTHGDRIAMPADATLRAYLQRPDVVITDDMNVALRGGDQQIGRWLGAMVSVVELYRPELHFPAAQST